MPSLDARTSLTEAYWSYYLLLESDVERLLQYIEPDSHNLACYGPHVVKTLLAIGSEVDVVMKDLVSVVDPCGEPAHKRRATIADYRQFVHDNVSSEFDGVEVKLARTSLSFVPWSAWWGGREANADDAQNDALQSGTPLWWKAYNAVKHERVREYAQGNLENTLQALAGLFVALCCLGRHEGITCGLACPKLLSFADKRFGEVSIARYEDGTLFFTGQPCFTIGDVRIEGQASRADPRPLRNVLN